MKCSVIIPVYNGAETISALLARLELVLVHVAEKYEAVLINDGSRDNSWEIIAQLARQYPWVRGFDLIRNYGQHNALLAGIRAARYEVIVTMDDDLQNPPEEIPALLAKLEEGYDVVYGIPKKVRQNIWRTLTSYVIRLVLRKMMGSEVAGKVSPFRAFRTSIRGAFANYASTSVFVDVLLTWGAARFAVVPVRQDTRQAGTSTYTFGKLLRLATNMLTGFSILPLRVASMIGFFFTFFGGGLLVYVIGRYVINGGSIPGFPFLASVITIFSGATLFSIGIIGEYLARIYTNSMGHPPYVVREESVIVRDPKSEIIHLSTDGLDATVSILASSSFKPLRYLVKELGTELTDFWLHSITDSLQAPSSQGFLAVLNGTPIGLLVYSDNPWETNLLGKKAAVINTLVVDGSLDNREQVTLSILDYALLHASANGIQFLLCKTYTDDFATIHALESRGFLLMDTVLDCYYDYRRVLFESLPRPVLADGVTLRLATPADCDELVAVAGLAFREHYGRFHADERIGRQIATRAYEQWMRSSLDGYADWIHLAMVAGRIVGFSIWKRPSKAESQLKVRVGHYSISGIHPDYHGRGLFTTLTHTGMQFLEGIADIIEGPTHINNYGVQLGYSKLGWRICSDARHSFSKWLD